MTEKVTAIMAARKSSGITQIEAADMMDLSVGTYRTREGNPDMLTIGDIKSIVPCMNGISKGIMKDWLDSIFLAEE